MFSFQKRNRSLVAYRWVRVGQGFSTRYLGSGRVAELAWDVDQFIREQHMAAENTVSEARETLHTADLPLQCAQNIVTHMFRGVLLAAGFHQRKNEWRRRCGPTRQAET